MKIAFFTDTYNPSLNGVVTSTNTFRRELEDLGHTVHVFAPAAPRLPEETGVTRIASVPLPTEPNCRIAVPFPRSLLIEFARSHFDIVHTQTPFGLGIWGAALARMFRKPLIHTYHTFFAEYSHYLKVREGFGRAFAAQYSRIYCNRCEHIIVPSPMFIDILRSYRITTPIEVIPTGVSIPARRLTRTEARDRLDIPQDRQVLLYVGRLAKEKNVEFLLDALKALRERTRRDPLLVIVGDGPHRGDLENAAAERGLQDRIRWTGGVPHQEVFHYYSAADVFTFASRTETQGLVAAEAMSCGLPVVALKGPGVNDFVTPARGGFLTDPTVDAFLHPLKALLDDPETREEASQAGIKAGPGWSSRRQAERLLERYEQLLVRTPPARPRIIRRALATVSAGIAAGDRVIRRRH